MAFSVQKLARFAVLLGGLVVASAAQAATYIITYTGTILPFATDVTGVFGPAGASLAGQSITAVFTLTDPSPGSFVSNDGITGFTDGGTLRGTPIPVVSKFTINGITRTVGVDTGYFGEVTQVNSLENMTDSLTYDQVKHWNQDLRLATASIPGVLNVLEARITSTVNSVVSSSNFTDPLDYTIQPGDAPSGTFQIYTVAADDTVLEYAYGNFAPNRVTIAAAAAQPIPEPATWAMLIAGFGLVGTVARRRRPTRAVG